MRDFEIEILEYMAGRFSPIPTDDEFLDSRYQWQMVDNGAEWPYYRFFYHLSKMLQPNLVVELGGWQGTAAAHFAAGCNGLVCSIDHHGDPGDQVHQAKMIEAVNRYDNMFYEHGWTNPEAAARECGKHFRDAPDAYAPLKRYFERKQLKIDILFIDSWHVYEHAKLDWEHYKPLLSSPALVICDDIQAGGDEHSPISGMLRFWDELPEPKFLNANLHPGTNMGFLKYEPS